MGYCCGRLNQVGFWGEECGKHWDFGQGKLLSAVSRAYWAILVEAWKTVVLKALWTVEIQLKRFQTGAGDRGTVLATDLETILVIFLAKNLAIFCPYLKKLHETKLKNNRLVSLAEEISRHLMVTLARGYQSLLLLCRSIMQRSKWGKKKYKMHRERAPGN